MDRAVRVAAVAIKSSGGLLVSDIEKQLPPYAKLRVEEIGGLLESRGLTTRFGEVFSDAKFRKSFAGAVVEALRGIKTVPA
jgi:hypothetical protein